VAADSDSVHQVESRLWPCWESSLDAAVSWRDNVRAELTDQRKTKLSNKEEKKKNIAPT